MILYVGTQASSSINKKRGVVTGKRTVAIVRASGESRVTYEPTVARPPKEVCSRLVSDMSAFIKDRAPMLYPTFGDMPAIGTDDALRLPVGKYFLFYLIYLFLPY